MKPDLTAILRACRMFARVEGAGFERLLAMGQMRHFSDQEMVFRQDDPCPGLLVVGTGLVRVYKLASSGKEHVLHLVGPGGTFAEVAAIGNFACPAFAQAIESTTCALLPTAQLNQALRDDHELCLHIMVGLTLWVRHLVGLTEDIALRDAAGRVARYLLSVRDPVSQSVRLPSLKRHLASHLNLTSETLSRTLRRLTDAGLIEMSAAQELRVLDAQRLDSVAEGMFPAL